MLEKLRKENQDSMVIGFYKRSSNFSFFNRTEDLTEILKFQKSSDQKALNGTVMLVYDETRMSNGDFGMRAYRISK